MPEWGYLIIAIALIVILTIIFFISFIVYRKTPLPKGCEDMKIDDNKCLSCSNEMCQFKKRKEK